METITLTAPETKPANPTYTIVGITEDWQAGSVEIRLIGANGETRTAFYGAQGLIGANGQIVSGSPTGATILKAQNKMNFSTTSRVKRIYQQLLADGVLAGAVTGVPD